MCLNIKGLDTFKIESILAYSQAESILFKFSKENFPKKKYEKIMVNCMIGNTESTKTINQNSTSVHFSNLIPGENYTFNFVTIKGLLNSSVSMYILKTGKIIFFLYFQVF